MLSSLTQQLIEKSLTNEIDVSVLQSVSLRICPYSLYMYTSYVEIITLLAL